MEKDSKKTVEVDKEWAQEQWAESVYRLVVDPYNYSNDARSVVDNYDELCRIGEVIGLGFWETASEVSSRENIEEFKRILDEEARIRPWENMRVKLLLLKEQQFFQGNRVDYLSDADIEQLIEAVVTCKELAEQTEPEGESSVTLIKKEELELDPVALAESQEEQEAEDNEDV